jgi:hypothetical protein
MNPPRNNDWMMSPKNSTACASSSPRRAPTVMMLALTLCCAGCASWRSPPALAPSVLQGPLGNAVLVTLPRGTELVLPAATGGRPGLGVQLGQALVNEVAPAGTNRWRLTTDLRLCTPAYLAERDAAELQLLLEIQRLKLNRKVEP